MKSIAKPARSASKGDELKGRHALSPLLAQRAGMRFLRPGWTLLELMVAISVLGVVMTVSGTLFVALSRSERNALRSCAAQQTLARLHEQFRRDVHLSDSADIAQNESGQATLTLSNGEHTVAWYSVRQHELQRLAAVPAGEHRETFRIPDAEWSFQQVSDDVPKVRLSLQRPADTMITTTKEFLPNVEWRFEAVLGLTTSPALPKGGP